MITLRITNYNIFKNYRQVHVPESIKNKKKLLNSYIALNSNGRNGYRCGCCGTLAIFSLFPLFHLFTDGTLHGMINALILLAVMRCNNALLWFRYGLLFLFFFLFQWSMKHEANRTFYYIFNSQDSPYEIRLLLYIGSTQLTIV